MIRLIRAMVFWIFDDIDVCLYWRKQVTWIWRSWDSSWSRLTTSTTLSHFEHYFSNGGRLDSLHRHGLTSITVSLVMLVYKIIISSASINSYFALCSESLGLHKDSSALFKVNRKPHLSETSIDSFFLLVTSSR
jgi:hypothetical protein